MRTMILRLNNASRVRPLNCRVVLTVMLIAFSYEPADLISQEPGGPRESTGLTMLMVRRAIRSYIADSGRLPHDLVGLCASSRPGCIGLSSHRPRDGWGSELAYRVVDSEYELRSLGPDRRADTPDDMVFTPASERAVVAKFAGCYTVNWAKWWDEFPGDRIELRPEPIEEGYYPLHPPPNLSNAVWWWAPTPNGGVRLIWSVGFKAVTFNLQPESDGELRGWVEFLSDVGPPVRHSASAIPTDCHC